MKDKLKFFIENFHDVVFLFYIKHRSRWLVKKKLNSGLEKIDSQYDRKCRDYWKRYCGIKTTGWHNFYAKKSGKEDFRYIPEDVFYTKIEPFFNNLKFCKAYSDKSLYSLWFQGAVLPKTIFKNVAGVNYDDDFNVLDKESALELLSNERKLIFKASIESGGGKNIDVLELEDEGSWAQRIALAIEEFDENFVVQRFLEQHPIMGSLNPSSVNTIRMMTLFLDDEVHVLSSHVRIGVDGAFYDHGGIVCGVSEDGILSDVAYKYKVGDVITEHPQGHPFSGIEVPSYKEMKAQAIRQHKKFAHFKLISWDFAVDSESRPVLIEYNLRWQGLNHHQLTDGPLFGDLTDKVLDRVFLEGKRGARV